MKYQIDYLVSKDRALPCAARTEHRGEPVYGHGSTWQEAKDRLLQNLKSIQDTQRDVPPRETVEVGDEEEMPTVSEVTAAVDALNEGEKERTEHTLSSMREKLAEDERREREEGK